MTCCGQRFQALVIESNLRRYIPSSKMALRSLMSGLGTGNTKEAVMKNTFEERLLETGEEMEKERG